MSVTPPPKPSPPVEPLEVKISFERENDLDARIVEVAARSTPPQTPPREVNSPSHVQVVSLKDLLQENPPSPKEEEGGEKRPQGRIGLRGIRELSRAAPLDRVPSQEDLGAPPASPLIPLDSQRKSPSSPCDAPTFVPIIYRDPRNPSSFPAPLGLGRRRNIDLPPLQLSPKK